MNYDGYFSGFRGFAGGVMRLFFRSAAVPHKQGVALPLHRRARKPRVSAMLSGFRSGGAAYVYTLLLLVCRDGLPASGC